MLVLLFGGSCVPIEQENSLSSEQNSQITSAETETVPIYIDSVWPDAGTHTSWSESNDGWLFSGEPDNRIPSVCAEFWIEFLLESGDFLSREEIVTRFSMKIDDRLFGRPDNVLFSDTVGVDGPEDPETGLPKYRIPPGSPFFVCFTAPLEPGEHTATIIALKTTGEELRYTWSFILADDD